MARKGRSFPFDIFDNPDGAYSLFENSIRSGMDYDANIEDQFDAVVLTRPVKITSDMTSVSFQARENGGKQKFAFMVRLLGDKSPHKFLPNPCLMFELETADAQRRAFNLIQQHTKVVMNASQDQPLPGINSIVRVSLERNRRGSFKTDFTKEFISIIVKDPAQLAHQNCQNLVDKMHFGDLIQLGVYGEPVKATYVNAAKNQIPDVENGKLSEGGVPLVPPDTSLFTYTGGSGPVVFIPEAIDSFNKVMRDYMDAHGDKKISISAHYRDYDEQVRMKEQKIREGNPSYAANPGHSMHGWAVAFDVNNTLEKHDKSGFWSRDDPNANIKRFDSPIYKWLDNGGKGRHGWINPPGLRKGTGPPIEAWHWENVALRKKHFPSVPPPPPGGTTDAETTPEDS